jgi:aspartate/methionine/tyrosine aminotransferase
LCGPGRLIGFPRLTMPGTTADDFAAGLVEAEGVLLLPGSRFGHDAHHVRLGFGRTDLPQALERLSSFLGRLIEKGSLSPARRRRPGSAP